ncbi:uncharacterized protein HMPREF1541_08671 [Cyphellophora europaea CBS 101466]|uniref:Peptidase M24 domain-containing protein n=1 Tax=Cyphellophora europaea (strain CBS 101466) TaxID=1220924 RepID=W2RL01_CYPE1|nr:uncharacterized protein HMPREF1541_08671 [Cyphellophora europaea CBS 101466]ETN36394.1 hypothetical protein HMPREF1541_08671 [Cyphellophora europaea CBS 101466]
MLTLAAYFTSAPGSISFDASTKKFSDADIAKVQKCSIDNLHMDLSFLEDATPIKAEEFIHRRDRLAQALHTDGVDAFVLEPGYTFQYYGNVSQWDWEPWEPEERPFLMVMQPTVGLDGTVKAKTTYLAPHFEEDRVRMLGIPADSELDIVIWEEHWDPYQTLLEQTFDRREGLVIMTDEEMRDYIVRGLTSAGFHTVGLTPNVDAVRQQKSPAELSLLRAVNTGTVEALRKMRPCLIPGLTENQVMTILDNALLSVPGFGLFFNIVLFDENAALPHGGKATGGKTLTHHTVVLIDVGAHYRGYSSDICRSFLIDPPRGQTPEGVAASDPQFATKQKVFDTVLAAQNASIAHFRPGETAASVDVAARSVIAKQGWEKQFTHRVGHGIGIKAHESPYLHKGNTRVKLREGMTFTSEPGVYLTGRFGVRSEDVFVVTERGSEVRCLSGPRAKGFWEP